MHRIPRRNCWQRVSTACRRFTGNRFAPAHCRFAGMLSHEHYPAADSIVAYRLIVPQSIRVASLSGVSGAGRKAEIDYLFCECNESARAYGVPEAPASRGNRAGIEQRRR